jgi:dinuclear metal center YbgI/SA1388 family protein
MKHGISLQAGEVRHLIESLAPPHLAESYDNVGWQIGWDGQQVRAVLVTLDVDLRVVMEAERLGANLIVAHHPLFFFGLKRIDPSSARGTLLRRLLCAEIGVFAAHTNLDAVRGGVNDALAAALGLEPRAPLRPVAGAPGDWGFGAICEVPTPLDTDELARRVHEQLGTPTPRVAPGGPGPHRRIALLGGSGAEMIPDAIAAGCSCFITGEVKYHQAQEAVAQGLTIIEAGHFWSERPVLEALAARLRPLGVPVHISEIVTSPFAASWEEVRGP